ncbi:MAG: hypothetical protein H7338_08385 [Candidatus Sericytochromatia bacterium]|nr:hypothetical protein [Candidatus Sericytochromatia bacterium]
MPNPLPIPSSVREIADFLAGIPYAQRVRCCLAAAELALPVWEMGLHDQDLRYRDSVVGMGHVADRTLPGQALAYVRYCYEAGRFGRDEGISTAYAEPIAALQDDGWSLPEPRLLAYYAAFNAYEMSWKPLRAGANQGAVAVDQAISALALTGGDATPEAKAALFARWWRRCVPGQTT